MTVSVEATYTPWVRASGPIAEVLGWLKGQHIPVEAVVWYYDGGTNAIAVVHKGV